MHAIETDSPFYCHEGMKIVNGEYDPSTADRLLPCGGWLTVYGDPATKDAAVRAARLTIRAHP